MKKAFLEMDFLLAGLALVVLAALTMQAVDSSLLAAADAKGVSQLEVRVLKAAQFLAGKCEFDVSECSQILEQLNSTARVFPADEAAMQKRGEKPVMAAKDGVCVRRFAVLRGREFIGEVCSN